MSEEQQPHVHAVSYEEFTAMQRMAGQQNAHAIMEALSTLNEEQLVALKGVLMFTNENPHTNGYFQGIISQILQKTYNICPGCGVNHDEVPPEWSEQEESNSAEKASTEVSVDVLMEEYNVVPYTGIDDQVQCKGCGLVSPNIEDRMLRPPGVKGCEGCQNKAKWG